MLDSYVILIASSPPGQAVLGSALGAKPRLVAATTCDEALAALARGVDLIVASVDFDESRMFDLLRMAKADARFRSLPFLCVRALEGDLPPALSEGLDIACKALGAVAFIDLAADRKARGARKAAARLRRTVKACLAGRR